MMCIAAIAILFLFSSAYGRTASDQSQTQNTGQKILTADDFKDRMMIRGAELEEKFFHSDRCQS